MKFKVGDEVKLDSGKVGKIIDINDFNKYYYKVKFEDVGCLNTNWSREEIELYDPNQDEETRVYTFQEMVDELSKSIEDREIEVKTSFGEQYRGKLSDILLIMGTRCSSKRIVNEISKSEWRIVD